MSIIGYHNLESKLVWGPRAGIICCYLQYFVDCALLFAVIYSTVEKACSKSLCFIMLLKPALTSHPALPILNPLSETPLPLALRGLISGRKKHFPSFGPYFAIPGEVGLISGGTMGLISVRQAEVYYRAGFSSGRWRLLFLHIHSNIV